MFLCPVVLDGSEPSTSADTEEWNESGSSTEAESQSTELFWLDYQADCGRLTSFIVHKVRLVKAAHGGEELSMRIGWPCFIEKREDHLQTYIMLLVWIT